MFRRITAAGLALPALMVALAAGDSFAQGTYSVGKKRLYTDTLVVPIKEGADDAEESADGTVYLGSSDLELINDEVDQVVGLRFQDISIPNGATIVRAYIQFHVDEPGSGDSELVIHGQAADDVKPFTATPGDVSSRPQTNASAKWRAPPWTTTEETGAGRRTPNLAKIIQEIVDRSGWKSGNNIALIISGSGTRTAASFNGAAGRAAQLHIDFLTSVLPSLATAVAVRAPETMYETAWSNIAEGALRMEFGLYYYGLNYRLSDSRSNFERDEGDFGYGSAYADIAYVTKPWKGFKAGASLIGAVQLYEANDGDWNLAYRQNVQLYEAYVEYGASRSYGRVGRQVMDSIRFAYDAAEGVSIRLNETGPVSILFESFWKGLTAGEYDAISEWRTVRDIEGRRGEDASDLVFSIEADIEAVPDYVYLTPYYYTQRGLASAVGANLQLAYGWRNIEFDISMDLMGVSEETTNISSDTGWTAYIIEPAISAADFSFGVGYRQMSTVDSGKVPIFVRWLDAFNPLDNGRLINRNHAQTYYVGMTYEWNRFEFGVQYAQVRARDNARGREWSASVVYDVNRNLSTEVNFVDYDERDRIEDVSSLEVLLRYTY